MKNSIRILIVDDHQIVLWGLRQLIDSQNPEMEIAGTATSASEAIEKAKTLQPDLILLDLDLGQESALSIVPQLKSCSKAAILVLTGVRDQLVLDEAILSGARGILRKDEATDRLLDAVRKVASGQVWLDREATGRVFNALVARDSQKSASVSGIKLLTEKEKEVVRALAGDGSAPNKVLAKQLCVSTSTLRNYLSSIYQKLEVDNRMGLYMYAKKHSQDLGQGVD